MKPLALLLAFTLFGSVVSGQKPPTPNYLNDASKIKKGAVGVIGAPGYPATLKVEEVVDKQTARVRVSLAGTFFGVYLFTLDTDGVVDGAELVKEATAVWEVVGTRKVGTRTLFVLQPPKK